MTPLNKPIIFIYKPNPSTSNHDYFCACTNSSYETYIPETP